MAMLMIFGPPAVGKMSIGRAVAARTDYRLFHNHHTIEPLLEVFGFGTPAFTTLNREFRRRVIEEAAASDLDLIFTFVWNLGLAADTEEVRFFVEQYAEQVAFVELTADLETRLARNGTQERLAHKPSKRDLAWSDQNVVQMEQTNLMNTDLDPTRASEAIELIGARPHLRLETAERTVEQSAEAVVRWLAGNQSQRS